MFKLGANIKKTLLLPGKVNFFIPLMVLFTCILYTTFLISITDALLLVAIAVFLIQPLNSEKKNPPQTVAFMVGITAISLALIFQFYNFSDPGKIITINSLSTYLFFLCSFPIIVLGFNKATLIDQSLSVNLLDDNIQPKNGEDNHAEKLTQKNRELYQQIQELERINIKKDELINVIAHDLKSPLNRNLGLIDILEHEGGLSETQQHMLNLMKENNLQGADLIAYYLEKYSQKNDRQIKFETFQVRSLISKLMEGFEENLKQKDIKLHYNLPGEQTSITSDKQGINRILENLVSNAIKFSSYGSQIWLEVEANNEKMTIICKDEGPGISQKEQAIIFNEFQKLSNRPTGGENSTGLGLFIVKQVVDNLAGNISIDSKKGKGSAFTVTIPAVKVHPENE